LNHMQNLLIKFIMIGALSVIFLSLIQTPALPFSSALIIALIITGVLYVTGDLFILPKYGNYAAAGGDALMAVLILWIANFFIIQELSPVTVAVTALAIGAGEWFFHRYLKAEPAQAKKKPADSIEAVRQDLTPLSAGLNFYFTSEDADKR
jgi:hypothetical protein